MLDHVDRIDLRIACVVAQRHAVATLLPPLEVDADASSLTRRNRTAARKRGYSIGPR
jgi:hypothetical protein